MGSMPPPRTDRRGRSRLPSSPQAPPRRWLAWAGVVAVLVAMVAAFWVSREELGHQFAYNTQRARLLDDAAQALAAGQLSRSDGRGAAELYQAVLAQDPDHQGAREGVLATGRAALAQARIALAQEQPERAEPLLELARRLSVPEAEIAPMVEVYRRQAGDEGTLAALLQQADQLRRSLPPEAAMDSALALYERALAIAPTNALAASGRSRLLSDVLQSTLPLIDSGDLARAQDLVDRVAVVDPGHVDLPPVRARLAEARPAPVARQAPWRPPASTPPTPAETMPAPDSQPAPLLSEPEIADLMDGFERSIADERFLAPPGDSAWDRLRQLWAGAPTDARTLRADAEYRAAAAACFERHLPSTRLTSAEACLEALRTVDPGSSGLADRSRRLASRWIGLAEERLGSAEHDGAWRAFESARMLDPSHPALPALAARLEQAGGG